MCISLRFKSYIKVIAFLVIGLCTIACERHVKAFVNEVDICPVLDMEVNYYDHLIFDEMKRYGFVADYLNVAAENETYKRLLCRQFLAVDVGGEWFLVQELNYENGIFRSFVAFKSTGSATWNFVDRYGQKVSLNTVSDIKLELDKLPTILDDVSVDESVLSATLSLMILSFTSHTIAAKS